MPPLFLPLTLSQSLSSLMEALLPEYPAWPLYPERVFAPAMIDGVYSDSRQVRPGGIFVALVGTAQGGGSNGHHYVQFAIETRQATAVIIQADQVEVVKARVPEETLGKVPVFVVENTYPAVALLTSALYGWPGKQLPLFGVLLNENDAQNQPDENAAADSPDLNRQQAVMTVLAQTLALHSASAVGQIGLDGFRVAHTNSSRPRLATRPVGHTPPWAEELQPLLAQMLEQQCKLAVMALHPQGMQQHRYLGCTLQGLLSLSDNPGALFSKQALPLMTPDGVTITRQRYTHQGIQTTLQVEGHAPVQALFPFLDAELLQLARLCVAMVLALYPDRTLETIVDSVSGLENGPLWEPWCSLYWLKPASTSTLPQPHVLLDSASSPAQVEASLNTVKLMMQDGVFLRQAPSGEQTCVPASAVPAAKLWVVIGAPGDHHPEWRGPLATMLAQGADQIVLTADNPRGEPVEKINRELVAAFPDNTEADSRVVCFVNRADGIRFALTHANPQDVVLICGKGRRFTYQILADGVYPWEDEAVVRQALAKTFL